MFGIRAWGCLPLLLLALGGCEEQIATVNTELRPVRTKLVILQRIEDSRRAIGEIRPRQEADLGFRVSGKIISRNVDVGTIVKRGDIIARIDNQDSRNRLQSALADVNAADAVLMEAQLSESRQRILLAQGITTQAKFDIALKNTRGAQASLDSAKVAVAMARDQVTYTELAAEFDGIVTAVGAEAGQVVNVGQMIVRLAPPTERDAVFAIAESAFEGFQPEDRPQVTVTLLSDPAISSDGAVREVSPIADPATRTYQVKVGLENPPEQMRFGASVSGKLKALTAPVVILPGSALFDLAGKPAVWVYHADTSTVALQRVTVKGYETDRIIVSDGIAQGDVVVTAGVNQLREGQKVRLAEDTQP